MANWRKTKSPGVYVAHRLGCPAQEAEDGRCRCTPSWRGRRRNPATGKAEWQRPVTQDRSEVLAWLGAGRKAGEHLHERASAGRTFESLGDEWIAVVAAGRIGRRKAYPDSTVRDYERSYRNFLRPEFGPMPADDIGEVEWQMWVDHLSREGLSRSRITTHVAVASAIYAWAIVPSRQLATRNPLRLVELPPNDEKPRLRVAFAPEAEQLLEALAPKDAVPYAIALGEPPPARPRAGSSWLPIHEPSPERLHEWRKRVKDLWYHHRLLRDAWKSPMKACTDEYDELGGLLGDDHDLAVLAAALSGDAPPPPSVDLPTLLQAIAARRGALQAQAFTLARHAYVETPKAFGRRLGGHLAASAYTPSGTV